MVSGDINKYSYFSHPGLISGYRFIRIEVLWHRKWTLPSKKVSWLINGLPKYSYRADYVIRTAK